MHPVVNHLIQLQELNLIRDEQRVTSQSKHLQQLDASIKAMTSKLPSETRTLYQRLEKRDPIVVSSVSDSHCAICGMQLAISFIQMVRHEKDLHACPNCARILYYPEISVRRIAKRERRTAPRKMGIARFSSHTLMIPSLEATNSEDAIAELAKLMASEGFVDNEKHLLEAALKREALFSTAVEHGLAFPHVRGVEGGGLALALGISRKGIDFGGSAKGKTRIIFLIAIPAAASAFYLKLLAGLTQTFMKPDARKELQSQKTPDDLWKSLTKLTRSTVK